MAHHQALQNTIEDQVTQPEGQVVLLLTPLSTLQLSLAAIHYLRTHYQEAIDIYKKVLLDNRYGNICVLHPT